MNNLEKISNMIYDNIDEFPWAKKNIMGGGRGYDPAAVKLFLQDVALLAEKYEVQLEEMQRKLENGEQAPGLESVDGNQVAEDEKIKELKEQYKRKMKQAEFYQRSQQQMVLDAEEFVYSEKEKAKKEANGIVEEAKSKANHLLREVKLIKEEKEKEISDLEQHLQEMKSIAKYILSENDKEKVNELIRNEGEAMS